MVNRVFFKKLKKVKNWGQKRIKIATHLSFVNLFHLCLFLYLISAPQNVPCSIFWLYKDTSFGFCDHWQVHLALRYRTAGFGIKIVLWPRLTSKSGFYWTKPVNGFFTGKLASHRTCSANRIRNRNRVF